MRRSPRTRKSPSTGHGVAPPPSLPQVRCNIGPADAFGRPGNVMKGIVVKLLLVIAAPLALAAAALPAQAQDHVVHSTTVTRHVETDVHHSTAPHHGWHWKTVCQTHWTHHEKIRSCKKVRVRW
jgi:hypothetical protein